MTEQSQSPGDQPTTEQAAPGSSAWTPSESTPPAPTPLDSPPPVEAPPPVESSPAVEPAPPVETPPADAAPVPPTEIRTETQPPSASSWSPPTSDSAASTVDEHPEIPVGAAFAGGFVLAMILKRLAR